jgi:hypothetical protein
MVSLNTARQSEPDITTHPGTMGPDHGMVGLTPDLGSWTPPVDPELKRPGPSRLGRSAEESGRPPSLRFRGQLPVKPESVTRQRQLRKVVRDSESDSCRRVSTPGRKATVTTGRTR